VSRKYLYTGKLSFSACLAENPGALKITSHRPLGVTVICKVTNGTKHWDMRG